MLKKRSTGEVVYIEVNHDFMEALAAFLHSPMGDAAENVARDAPDLGIVRLRSSVAGIRDALWQGNKVRSTCQNCL